MAWSINDMKGVPLPFHRRDGRSDRNPSLLLLLHPIHHRCPLIDLPHAVDLFCIVEDPLGDGRFPGIDMGHKPNVSRSGESFLSSHLSFSIVEHRGYCPYFSPLLVGLFTVGQSP
jgi:hypothetical protein